jgi:hypothetical protein
MAAAFVALHDPVYTGHAADPCRLKGVGFPDPLSGTLNVTGRKTADREELKWFINTEIWIREDFALNHHRVAGNRFTLDEAATELFYRGIGVAPVQFV